MCISQPRRQYQLVYSHTLTYDDVSRLSGLERSEAPAFAILRWYSRGAIVCGFGAQVRRALWKLGQPVRILPLGDYPRGGIADT